MAWQKNPDEVKDFISRLPKDIRDMMGRKAVNPCDIPRLHSKASIQRHIETSLLNDVQYQAEYANDRADFDPANLGENYLREAKSMMLYATSDLFSFTNDQLDTIFSLLTRDQLCAIYKRVNDSQNGGDPWF